MNALDGEAPAAPAARPRRPAARFSVRESGLRRRVLESARLCAARHLLSYGGNYRHNNFDLSFAPRGASRDEGGVYVQDEIFLSEHFRWIVGARIDRFDVLQKAVLSPRTTFLMKPRPSQTFRLSFNRAFRAPSFVNSFFDTSFLNDVDLGPAGQFQFPAVAVGNEQLKEEGLTAYEAGYIGGFGRTTLGAALYLYRTRNTILFTQTGSYTATIRRPAGRSRRPCWTG